ncbi:F-box only protein 21-like [Cataglyphis hispanica]|uniref:F-box only protein 21-like n=1 Tax=Cataglyphis hispanica TaxID=1086592 RepID=UPI00217FFF1B|nr:F-box only protein 21-like [Cataglyphis hispanica]
MTYLHDKVKSVIHKIQFNWNIKIYKVLLNFSNKYGENIEIEYKQITSTTEDKSNTVEKSLNVRTKYIKFAVGMIVTHSHDSDDCDGVIIGWDNTCDIEVVDKLEWSFFKPCYYNFIYAQARNDIDVDIDCEQPYYIILTENKKCYVRQDAIRPCQPKKIDNIEIGKYFSNFEGTHYVPNETLRKHYPEDIAAILSILAK